MLRKFEHLQALLPSYAIVAAMQPHRASHTAGASTPSANLQLAVISDPNVTRPLYSECELHANFENDLV